MATHYVRLERLEDEPQIPSAMDDWDEAFWIATGIVVPGSKFDRDARMHAAYLNTPSDVEKWKPGTPIRMPRKWVY